MQDAVDRSSAIVRPPIAWAIALLAGLALNWLYPLPFVPAALPAAWIGALIFVLAFALAISAIVTIRKAATNVETVKPTTTIVTNGPYRFTRNPIYLGMFFGQIGLAAGLNNFWLLLALVPFYFVIRYGVIAREEAYLERKFAGTYLGYKSRVRRWL